MRDQFQPSQEIIEAFVECVIRPRLEKFSADSRRMIAAELWVYVDNVGTFFSSVEVGGKKARLSAVIRMRFREAFRGRLVMSAEARFSELESIAGCSGFILDADKPIDSTPRYRGISICYNDWDWKEP